MKQLLTGYAHYEQWANEQILRAVLALSPAQQQRGIASSFPSIYKTVLHVWDASSLWWQRLQKAETPIIPSKSGTYTMQELCDQLLKLNGQWRHWVGGCTEEDLGQMLSYKTMRGDAYCQPVHEILLHLNNHGTYHRGQLVTMLRQVGVEQIPATDYILFTRSVG